MAKLLYQGHGSIRITTDKGTVIYCDPYAGEGYGIPADLILVTHEHSDHNKVELVSLKENGKILRAAQMLVSGEYQKETVLDVNVEAVPAYNKNHNVNECVGYLITVDNKVIYFSGDTGKTDYMEEVLPARTIDLTIFPSDGVYNMTNEEASECAKIIGAKRNMVFHNSFDSLFDKKKAEEFVADGRLLLEPTEEMEL